MMRQFDDDSKQNAFDLIAGRYFEHNFGQISKADFEVLMFKIYLDFLNSINGDTSDYTIAAELGITESKVRSLKVKRELQYPEDVLDWKQVFIRSVQYAVYDDKHALVKLPIIDPNVKRNIEHRIDELHVYSEAQLNGKLLQMRPDHFVSLIQSVSDELGNADYDRTKLVKQLKATIVSDTFETDGIFQRIQQGEAIRDLSQDIFKSLGKVGIKCLLSSIPFGNVLEKYVEAFIDKL